ncbi:MAG: NAD-dependent epimerase/dehydratase family protein [Anaerofustis sp.]
MFEHESLALFEGLNIEYVYGDITDYESIKSAVNGCDLIFHVAGLVDIGSSAKNKMIRINVKGTEHVIQACKECAAGRLVYVSSVHAIPGPPDNRLITESDHFSPSLVRGMYAKTKAAATSLVLRYAHQGGDAVVVHPSGVIGPYEYKLSNMGQMIKDSSSGALKLYIDGAYNFVDVRDVAKGIRLAAEKGKTGGTYILSGETITVKELFDIVTASCGRPQIRHKFPRFLAVATAPLAEAYYKLLRKKPLFTSYSLLTLQTNSNFSNEKAKKELGFSPRPVRESVSDTIEWMMQEGMILCKVPKTSL